MTKIEHVNGRKYILHNKKRIRVISSEPDDKIISKFKKYIKKRKSKSVRKRRIVKKLNNYVKSSSTPAVASSFKPDPNILEKKVMFDLNKMAVNNSYVQSQQQQESNNLLRALLTLKSESIKEKITKPQQTLPPIPQTKTIKESSDKSPSVNLSRSTSNEEIYPYLDGISSLFGQGLSSRGRKKKKKNKKVKTRVVTKKIYVNNPLSSLGSSFGGPSNQSTGIDYGKLFSSENKQTPKPSGKDKIMIIDYDGNMKEVPLSNEKFYNEDQINAKQVKINSLDKEINNKNLLIEEGKKMLEKYEKSRESLEDEIKNKNITIQQAKVFMEKIDDDYQKTIENIEKLEEEREKIINKLNNDIVQQRYVLKSDKTNVVNELLLSKLMRKFSKDSLLKIGDRMNLSLNKRKNKDEIIANILGSEDPGLEHHNNILTIMKDVSEDENVSEKLALEIINTELSETLRNGDELRKIALEQIRDEKRKNKESQEKIYEDIYKAEIDRYRQEPTVIAKIKNLNDNKNYLQSAYDKILQDIDDEKDIIKGRNDISRNEKKQLINKITENYKDYIEKYEESLEDLKRELEVYENDENIIIAIRNDNSNAGYMQRINLFKEPYEEANEEFLVYDELVNNNAYKSEVLQNEESFRKVFDKGVKVSDGNVKLIENIVNEVYDLFENGIDYNIALDEQNDSNDIGSDIGDEKIVEVMDGYGKGKGKQSIDNEGLWNTQIDQFMKKYRSKGFKGVFARDQIKYLMKMNKGNVFSFIMNTNPSYINDGHWVAVYVTPDTLEYYDSFADQPDERFIPQMKLILKNWQSNKPWSDNIFQFKVNGVK